jgi:hypothetical protein
MDREREQRDRDRPQQGHRSEAYVETTAITTRLSSIMQCGRYVFEHDNDGKLICLFQRTQQKGGSHFTNFEEGAELALGMRVRNAMASAEH